MSNDTTTTPTPAGAITDDELREIEKLADSDAHRQALGYEISASSRTVPRLLTEISRLRSVIADTDRYAQDLENHYCPRPKNTPPAPTPAGQAQVTPMSDAELREIRICPEPATEPLTDEQLRSCRSFFATHRLVKQGMVAATGERVLDEIDRLKAVIAAGAADGRWADVCDSLCMAHRRLDLILSKSREHWRPAEDRLADIEHEAEHMLGQKPYQDAVRIADTPAAVENEGGG